MRRFIKIWLFSALLSFTALGMWKGIEWYYSRDAEDVPPIVITAEDLASAYENDLSSSSRIYEGNYVLITGVVSNKGDAGNYYTVNLVGNIFIIDLSFYDSAEIAKLNDIDIGDTITVKGKVEGNYAIYIQITNCKIE